VNDPLIYVRAVHFAASMLAAGAVFFIAFVAEPALRTARGDPHVPGIVRCRLAGLVWIGLVLALLSGAAWFVLTAAAMSDQRLPEVFSGGVLWIVLTDTEFGCDWLVRLVVACLLAGALILLLSAERGKSSWLTAAAVILAAALVGSLAWAGHAAGGLGVEAIVHPAADVLHLVAAAAWVGTLIPLAVLLATVADDTASIAVARTATLRFSTLGIASVGTLLVTGTINGWYLAGSIPALIGTDYGHLLLIKVALFFGMVAIAAVNRLRFTPRLVHGADNSVTPDALRQLRRNTVIEIVVGAIIIVIVAVLGTDAPGLHQLAPEHHHAHQAMAGGL
jgi:putative copper resistance protein D